MPCFVDRPAWLAQAVFLGDAVGELRVGERVDEALGVSDPAGPATSPAAARNESQGTVALGADHGGFALKETL